MKMITLAQYCLRGVGHDLSYHQALQDLQGDVFEEVITYLPKTHSIPHLSSSWQRFFSVPKRRFEMFPLRLLDYFRMYRLAHQPTVFFLETFNLQDVIALLVSTFICAKQHHRLYVLYRDGKEWSFWRKGIQRLISRCLDWRLGKRYVIFTDSELVAKSVAMRHKKAIVLPIPHTEIKQQKLIKEDTLNLWFPGAPRVEKGIYWIQHLAKTLLDDEVVLMVSREADIRDSQLKIEFLEPFMPREEYLKTLHRSHVILLPYDEKLYCSRTSGPFVEAIVAGKWVLTVKGTWMAYELLRFGLGDLVVDWENDLFFEHLKFLMRDPLMQDKMEKMQQCYLRFHSQKSFKSCLKTSCV